MPVAQIIQSGVRLAFCLFAFCGLMLAAPSQASAQQYWNTNGTSAAITAANWGTLPAGPFTNAYSSAIDMQFTATSTIAYVTTTDIANIIVNPGIQVTWTAAGTLTTGGAVRTINVGAGSNLDMGAQAFSTATGTGFIKNGGGILFTSNGNSYTGGFTLDAGMVIIGGVNALGNGGLLTINGGTLAANATRDLSGKYTNIVVGGNFTLGGVTGFMTSGNASAASNLTFTNTVDLGAATRTITLGGTGTYTFGGTISGASDTGLTINSRSGSGVVNLTGTNSFDGPTVINPGVTLAIGTTVAAGAAGQALLTTSGITLNGGGLTLNFASGFNANRVNDTAPINVNGGSTFNIGTSNPTLSESIGAVTLNSGQLNFQYLNNPSSGGSITLASFTRSGTTSALTVSSAANGTFVVTGAGSTAASEVIGPWATTGAQSGVAAQTDYAIFSGDVFAARAIAASAESTWSIAHAATSNYTLANGNGSAANGRLTATRNINTLRNTTTGGGTIAVNTATDFVTMAGSTFADADVIVLGTTAGGLTAGQPYYVRDSGGAGAGTFKLAASSGGTAIDITAANGSTLNAGITLPSGFNLGTYGILNGSTIPLVIGGNGGTITLPTTTSDNLYLTAGSGPIQIDAPIANNGAGVLSLVKGGSGAVTLRTTNTFTGGITINAGTLTFNTTGSWGGNGKNVTFGGAGTLTSTAAYANGGVLTVNAGAVGTITPASLTFASTTGSGMLIFNTAVNTGLLNLGNASAFTGTLQLRLTGNANYNGGVALQFSSLSDTAGSALQFVGGTSDSNQGLAIALAGDVGPLTFNNRQVQILDRLASNWEIRDNILANNNPTAANFWVINTDLSYTGGRPHTGAQTGRVLILSGSNTGANAFAGAISNGTGQLGVSKTGAGTWILSGNNSHSGGTTLSGAAAGRLNINSATALGTGTFTISGGDLATFDNTSAGALTLTNNNAMTWSNNFAYAGTQSLNLGTGNVTMGGNRTVVVNGTGTLTVGGVISGAFGITLGGTGTMSLTGASTFTGQVVIGNNVANTLKLQVNALADLDVASPLGKQSTAANGVIRIGHISNTSTLEFINLVADQSTNRQVQIGASANGSGGSTILNNSNFAVSFTNAAFNVAATGITSTNRTLNLGGSNTGNNTIAGAIINNVGTAPFGLVALTKSGTGTWLVTGTNTYSANTNVTGGTLTFGTNGTPGATTTPLIVSNPNIGPGTDVIVNLATAIDTTTGRLSGTIAVPSSGTNTATINTGGFERVFTVNQTAAATYPGVIAGAGNFTLGTLSTNTLTLTGANTYTGGTVITAGTLAADTASPNSATGTAAVTVTGGTLRGIGNIAGAITLNGGSIAPGDATNAGVLTASSLVNSPLTGSMAFNVSGGLVNSSQLSLTALGNLDLGTALTLSVTPFTGASDPSHFTIIATNAGNTGVIGAFSNFAEGATVFTNSGTGTNYLINYGTFPGESGNVVLSAAPIPEPSLFGLLLAAGVLGAIRRSRGTL